MNELKCNPDEWSHRFTTAADWLHGSEVNRLEVLAVDGAIRGVQEDFDDNPDCPADHQAQVRRVIDRFEDLLPRPLQKTDSAYGVVPLMLAIIVGMTLTEYLQARGNAGTWWAERGKQLEEGQ